METDFVKNIAVDKGLLYVLVQWAYLDDFDYNGAIRKLYKRHQLIPSKLREQDVRNAPFMQDNWVHAIKRDSKGDKYFDNLNSAIDLYNACMNDQFHLYIVPTVLNGVVHDLKSKDETIRLTATHAMDFIKDYATTLRVNEKDYEEFVTMSKKLVNRYKDANIFTRDKHYEACGLAESALFGLHYVVKKESQYIHFDYNNKDCGKSRKIVQIHRDLKLFAHNKTDDKFVVPQVCSVSFLLMQDQLKSQGRLNHSMWVDSNAIQDGNYVPVAERQ